MRMPMCIDCHFEAGPNTQQDVKENKCGRGIITETCGSALKPIIKLIDSIVVADNLDSQNFALPTA
jgi:hypothetical protein